MRSRLSNFASSSSSFTTSSASWSDNALVVALLRSPIVLLLINVYPIIGPNLSSNASSSLRSY